MQTRPAVPLLRGKRVYFDRLAHGRDPVTAKGLSGDRGKTFDLQSLSFFSRGDKQRGEIVPRSTESKTFRGLE